MFEYTIEFYEGELDMLKTPKELIKYLTDLHDEIELSDLSDLLRYFNEVEQYEKSAVLVEFAKANNIKV